MISGSAAGPTPQATSGRLRGGADVTAAAAIATLAVASIWLEPPLVLGLGATQIVLLAITVVVGALGAPLGQATVQQSDIRLVRFAAFVFLAIFP